MRIVVTGASGNVGTALLRRLITDPAVEQVVGIARRRPRWHPSRVRWVEADVARDDLRPHLEGADAVVHLAWLIQPSRNERITERVNVEGSRRTFEAAIDAGVPVIVHASSVAAYAPADPSEPVDESWPTAGIRSSYYGRQKAAVERILDEVEAEQPDRRIARLRPGLIFQRSAASEVRRYFGGPFVPGRLALPSLIPFVPSLPGLAGQVVHADDVADAYARVLTDDDARGAYNIGGYPPLDGPSLARLFHARPLPLPAAATRAVVDLTWRAHLHPVSPDWLDIARKVPVMRTDRARTELGWEPQYDAGEVILELMAGLRANAGADTPPLEPRAGGIFRIRELLTGIGNANPLDRRSAAGG